MPRNASHIASLLLAIWALVWWMNVSHEWSHHQHDSGHGHGSCSLVKHEEQPPVDGLHVQQLADASDCAVCDWDWAPARTSLLAAPNLGRVPFALRMDFPHVVAGHPSAWLVGVYGRRGPPEAR